MSCLRSSLNKSFGVGGSGQPRQGRKIVAHGVSRGEKSPHPASGTPLPRGRERGWGRGSAPLPMAYAMGYVLTRLSKLTGNGRNPCGSAAPLCGKAPPFRARWPLFSSSAPAGRLSLPAGAEEVGWYSPATERRSLSAQTPMRLRRTTDDENGGHESGVARRGPGAVQAYVESGGLETEICCGDSIPSHRLARAA